MALSSEIQIRFFCLSVKHAGYDAIADVGKFQTLARGRIPEHLVSDIVAAVAGLRDGMAQPLLDLLCHPADNDIVALEPSHHGVG